MHKSDMIKPAIQGTVDILKSCMKAETVKRVVLTSSAAAVTINGLDVEGGGFVMDESCWTDVEFLGSTKPPTWVSKLCTSNLDKVVIIGLTTDRAIIKLLQLNSK